MKQIPPYLTTAQVAKACQTPIRNMRRMLDRAGILERLGTRWIVGQGRLRERLPEVYERVFAHIELQTPEDYGRR